MDFIRRTGIGERGLRKDAAFIHRIMDVDEFGRESPPAGVGR
jgi:hypothetical protein